MKTGKNARRVVIVDDDRDFLAMVAGWLEPCYDVVTLGEGEGVVETIAGLEPDLVILDVHMRPDGFTVCRRLRAGGGPGNVPVVFLTTSRRDEDFIRSLDAAGTAYLTKPLTRRSLLSQVAGMILDPARLPA